VIFRIKQRWWMAILATVSLLAISWLFGGGIAFTGRLPSVGVAVLAGALAGLGCLALNFLVHCTLQFVLGADYLARFQQFAIDVIRDMRIVEAVTGGLMACLGEEPFFRGVLVPLFDRPYVGVVVAAIAFGFAHYFRRQHPGFLIWGIGEGLVFGLLFVHSGSILVPALAHGMFDTVGFLYFERLRDASMPRTMPGSGL
jgi:membrane protease YdiL (CAAX protease family)